MILGVGSKDELCKHECTDLNHLGLHVLWRVSMQEGPFGVAMRLLPI